TAVWEELSGRLESWRDVLLWGGLSAGPRPSVGCGLTALHEDLTRHMESRQKVVLLRGRGWQPWLCSVFRRVLAAPYAELACRLERWRVVVLRLGHHLGELARGLGRHWGTQLGLRAFRGLGGRLLALGSHVGALRWCESVFGRGL